MVEGSKPSGPAYRFILVATRRGIVKDIEVRLAEKEVPSGGLIKGTVTVSYPGRYDGAVVNAQVLGTSELVHYTSCNGKTVSGRATRLFVDREQMPDGRVEFVASVGFPPAEAHDIKFRASIIEQHKEIASDIAFARYG